MPNSVLQGRDGPLRSWRKLLSRMGPGLITGAADDDPSGIATYSQAGAQFGYGQLWTILFLLPMMIAVQDICARIGITKGQGLAGVIKDHYPRPILLTALSLVAVANIVNIAADLGAMAAAIRLLVPFPFFTLVLLFSAASLVIQVFMDYARYAKILKWLSASLIAYVLTAFWVPQNWPEVLRSTFVPMIQYDSGFLMILVALIGTTISPYLFFWQPSQIVEEAKQAGLIPRNKSRLPKWGPLSSIHDGHVRRVRRDTVAGMFFSQLAAWFVLITAAGSLHRSGKVNIRTAADAAEALIPLFRNSPQSGHLAAAVFCLGIISLGLIAIPTLAGSAAYAETLGWKQGLAKKLKNAPGFYSIIAIATFAGVMIEVTGIDPIKALIYSAVINGVIAVPLIFFVLRIGSKGSIMGQYKSGPIIRCIAWITFVLMCLAAAAMFISLAIGSH